MRFRPLSWTLILVGFLSLACGLPSKEELKAAEEARAAETAQHEKRVVEMRGHLQAIAKALPALPEETPCDAAAVTALRSNPVGDTTFWSYPWVSEAEWLKTTANAWPTEPTADPAMGKEAVSLEVRVAFRKPSEADYAKSSDLEHWSEQMTQRPPLLAVLHVSTFQRPVLLYKGAAFVDGSFQPGVAELAVSLWDLVGERMLCATRLTASSSSTLTFGGGVIPSDAETVVADDFQTQLRTAMNAAAERLSPGLRLML